jgi:hypothetical protein
MKLFKPFKVNVDMSLRFIFAALAIFLLKSNPILAAIVATIVFMFFPVLSSKKTLMDALRTGTADTETEEEKALLTKIEKMVTKLMDGVNKEKLTEKDVEKLIEKLNKETAKLTNDGMAELKKKMDEISKSNENLVADLKEANDALKTQSAEIKKMKDNGAPDSGSAEKVLSFKQALKAAFMEHKDTVLKEVHDDYGKRLSMKGFFERAGAMGRTPEMTLKAVDLFENVIGFDRAGDAANLQNIHLRLTALDPNRVSIPLNIYPHVMDVYQVKPISKPYMALLVVYDYDNGTATKAEGVAAAKSSFKFKTVIFPAFFVSTFFNLSDETLDDLEEAMAEIAAVAPDKIMDTIDGKIDRATGDDVSDIKGILHADKSTPYARQADANSISGAYIVDLIADAQLQCEQNRYRPNVVKMNPKTVMMLAAAKNSFDDSKSDRRVQFDNVGNPVAVCGLRIIKSNDLTTSQLLILDNTQPWIGLRKAITMEIGYNGTDMVEGQKTVMLKVRLAFGVRDKAAIIYVSDITAGIAALATA